jgi:hypothetical protein
MRELFDKELELVGPSLFGDGKIHLNLYLSYWYAALYVVVEGWTELGLSDETASALLTSPYVADLRRYRNGVFHFQRQYWDERRKELLGGGAESAAWVGNSISS